MSQTVYGVGRACISEVLCYDIIATVYLDLNEVAREPAGSAYSLPSAEQIAVQLQQLL